MKAELMNNELKPCPFCGSQAELSQKGQKGLIIKCTHCKISREQKVLHNNIEWLRGVMVDYWNRRAPIDIPISKPLSALAGDTETLTDIAKLLVANTEYHGYEVFDDRIEFGKGLIDTQFGYKKCGYKIFFDGAIADNVGVMNNCGQIWQLIFSRGYVIGKV